MQMQPLFKAVLIAVLSFFLCGCQGFLYPLISVKTAIEDPRVEGEHTWSADGDPCSAIITKVHPMAYKVIVTQSAGKTDLLLQLTKIKGQIFFQLSAFPPEPAKQLDEQAGEGMKWAFLTTLTSRPTYLIGKIVSFDPHLRITFFNTRSAAQTHLPKDIGDSFQTFPLDYLHPQKFDGLVIMPPEKLAEFIENSADDPSAFVDWGFAK